MCVEKSSQSSPLNYRSFDSLARLFQKLEGSLGGRLSRRRSKGTRNYLLIKQHLHGLPFCMFITRRLLYFLHLMLTNCNCPKFNMGKTHYNFVCQKGRHNMDYRRPWRHDTMTSAPWNLNVKINYRSSWSNGVAAQGGANHALYYLAKGPSGTVLSF